MGYIQHVLNEVVGQKWSKRLTVIVIVIGLLIGVTAIRIATKVTNPQSIISNYEWFYDQYNQIKATEAKAEIAKQTLDSTPKSDETYAFRASDYNGIRMVLQGMIGEYNSRSKQITRNLWKAKDLPYQIEQGEKK